MVFRLELQEEFEVLSTRNIKERRHTGMEAHAAQKAPHGRDAGPRVCASRPGRQRVQGLRAPGSSPVTSLPSHTSPTGPQFSGKRSLLLINTWGVQYYLFAHSPPLFPFLFWHNFKHTENLYDSVQNYHIVSALAPLLFSLSLFFLPCLARVYQFY